GAGPATPARPAGTPAAPAPDHAERARAAWQDTLGKPPEQRIARWLELLAADPEAPYLAAGQRESGPVQQANGARRAAARAAPHDRAPQLAQLAAQPPASAGDGPLAVSPILTAVPGPPIALAFTVREPTAVTRAWLYARARGEAGYRRSELRADGDSY